MNMKLIFPILSVVALVAYTVFNFSYLPLSTIFPDEQRFINEAIALYQTGEFGFEGRRAWEMPLTAAVYSLLYGVSGSTVGLIVGARLLQSGLLICQGFLIGRISAMAFRSETAAVTAGAITLFYPFFIYYQGLLLSETIFNTFLIAGIFFLYQWRSRGFTVSWPLFVANLCLMTALYAKGSLTILPPMLTFTFAFLCSRSRETALRAGAIAITMFVLLMSPWWIRNYGLLGEFVPFTTNSGWVLYTGNNPLNHSGGTIVGVDVENVPEIEQLPEYLWHKEYTRRAFGFMQEHPLECLKLAGVKFLRFWRLYPYAEGWNTGHYKLISLFSFGVVLCFALFSVGRYSDFWAALAPIFVLIIYFTLLHMVTGASIRYRLPLEPFLIVLASPSIADCIQALKTRISQ